MLRAGGGKAFQDGGKEGRGGTGQREGITGGGLTQEGAGTRFEVAAIA